VSNLGKEKFCADCDKSEIKDEDIFCDGIKVNSVRYAPCKKSEDKFGKWTFNLNKDGFWNYELFESKKNAVKEGECVAKNRSLNRFYIGKTKEPVFSAIDVDSILERAWESLSSEVGIDLADKWYENINSKDVSRLEEMLCDTFEKWKIETNNVPKCYAITEFEEIEV